ncbi:hypothetical protein [Magnetospirillum sp. XM-1]|uniref:hypothetical protein n=1 Tax=Magnetospirillum sp. XM-1 TaxID=1663591 RepID=UPI0012E37177|nr:hypothetical protein [Magnetospirillum sp. XM-1]
MTEDHLAGLAAGTVTQAELARELGISEQAVSKGLKRRRDQGGATAPAAVPAKALPAPADRPPEPQPQQVATAETLRNEDEAEAWAHAGGQAWRGLATNYVATIGEVNAYMRANRGKIGPVAMGGLVRALRESEEGLRRLGLLPTIAGGNQASDQPASLTITVLTPGEEQEIRAEIAERAGDELTERAGEELAEETPSSPTTPHHPTALIDRLPEAKDFEAWVAAQVYMKGAAWLRQVVAALGGQTAHGKDQLQKELLRVTGGDPERLRCLVGTG